jgi:hypothetical protein
MSSVPQPPPSRACDDAHADGPTDAARADAMHVVYRRAQTVDTRLQNAVGTAAFAAFQDCGVDGLIRAWRPPGSGPLQRWQPRPEHVRPRSDREMAATQDALEWLQAQLARHRPCFTPQALAPLDDVRNAVPSQAIAVRDGIPVQHASQRYQRLLMCIRGHMVRQAPSCPAEQRTRRSGWQVAPSAAADALVMPMGMGYVGARAGGQTSPGKDPDDQSGTMSARGSPGTCPTRRPAATPGPGASAAARRGAAGPV